ncbi:MAG: SusC/RagA family TonB-linked outer membrane protein, partial [Rikenellaceae bacterium]|nr:SusC/RagA family TonB-linked outer membrane protein [Rikenellaceae bacterium]
MLLPVIRDIGGIGRFYAVAFSNYVHEKTTLREVIWELQKQTDLVFVYNTADVEGVQVPDFSVSRKSVPEVLDLCLRQEPSLEYEFADDVVVIKRVNPLVRQQLQVEQRVLSGRVTDEKGYPVSGVAVMVQGTSIGVVTDGEGRYQIRMPEGQGQVLLYSMLGYNPVRITYTGQHQQNVRLQEFNNHMDKVVVTGYQKIERRTLTAAISTVDMERIGHINQPSIDKLLQGQVAGMTIVNTSGTPGALPQIRIRGTATISGSVQPLWVVDGMILDDPVNIDVSDLITNRNLISSGIGGVNVDDIESINILKDAAATALYGTRAGNGVIVITTRSGQIGRPQVRYNASIFVNERPRSKDAYMMNSKDRIAVNFEMIDQGVFSPSSPGPGQFTNASDFEKYYVDVVDRKLTWSQFEQKIKELETTNTDWFKHLFRNAVTHRHNIDVNGGTETIKYYASASFLDEQATAIGVGQKTYAETLKTDIRLHEKLKLITKLNVSARDNDSFLGNDSWENPYEYATYTTRAHRAYDEQGDPNYMFRYGQKFHYMENREQAWRQSKNFSFTANVALEWNILQDLHFRTSLSVMKQNTTDTDIATEESYLVRLRKYNFNLWNDDMWTDGGWRKDRSVNGRSLTLTSFVSYMPVVNDQHRFDVTFGNEIKDSKTLGITTEIYGYAHNRGHQMIPQWDLIEAIGRPYWTEDPYRAATLSFYGVLGYTFKNRYTASFNWRTDASNGFGLKTNERVNPIWAVGLNYQVKEESFLRDQDWLTFLTLRGSYGIQGNLPSESYSDVVGSFAPSDGLNPDPKLNITAPKNPGLKWEKIKNTNLALEFGLFNHRVTAVLEYYHRHTVDALGYRSVSQVTGFDRLQVNWASIKNKGWEITLNTINIRNRNFRWTTN